MKIIINIATHGNEKMGCRVVKEIKKIKGNKKLVVQIANKKAFKLHKRFVDQDLNRSFPGEKNGNYEERLAYKLSPIIKSADIVIDIHSTTSELTDAIIVTKFNKKILNYIQVIQPKYVLVMNATKNNTLISQAKIGIAFEYGKDGNSVAIKKTVLGIKRLLQYTGVTNIKIKKTRTIITNYFNVYSMVVKPKGYKLLNGIKNYKLVKRGTAYASDGNNKLLAKKSFYPILFGENNYEDIFGFSGKKINIKKI